MNGIVVDFGFTTLLTSQVISLAFCSEREKSDKFYSGAVNLRHGTLGFTSLPNDFFALKKSIDPGQVEPANFGLNGDYILRIVNKVVCELKDRSFDRLM